MSEKHVPIDEDAVNRIEGDIVQGIERTLGQLGETLPNQVDGLSQKQLRRAFKAVISYIYKKEDYLTEAEALSDREKRFIGGMFSLVEAGTQYSMHIISELHQEHLKEQQKKKEEENDNE